MLFPLIFSCLGAFSVWFIWFKQKPAMTSGVYSTPDKWFMIKYYLFYLLYQLRQKRKLAKSNSQDGGFGIKSKSSENEMESGQELIANQPKAVDAVYINGYSAEGYYLVAGTARRHDNIVQTMFILRIPRVGIFELPQAPETNLQAEKKVNSYAAGGLEMKCVESMKTWSVRFSGQMQLNRKSLHTVEMDLKWSACSPYFDFDTDTSAESLSRSIAREPWNREFFNKLKAAHQTHYEQFGNLKGKLEIGEKKYELDLTGMRDHSYGNVRDWGDIHRYAMNMFYLEDGTVGTVALVSMPEVTMSHMEFGFIYTSDGQKLSVNRIEECLYDLGEQQPPPNLFTINFKAGGNDYKLNFELLDRVCFYMGTEWEGKVYENFCRVTLNGAKGWGIAEWDYRHIGGRKIVNGAIM